MENSSSFALEQTYESTVDTQKQASSVLSEEQMGIYANRNKWCVLSWMSAALVIISGVSIYFTIKTMEDYYNPYQCLGLSMCILVLVVAFTGAMFSVRSCFTVKSVKAIMTPCYKKQKQVRVY
ncbi:Hypothetical_protein [Hexamita inflata]|uniref:Hypothetical_protein n=1 Tax=Hexamita inflata TaxID=28002 RepID=A0AA86P5G8_9EUKA|nr:Hypothetical protein HINF_LOCUS19776 [Hexamita inflata]